MSAGSSLWIRPSKCLGLEPKWHWPLWNSKTAHPTRSCLHSTSGVSWGSWEWTFFKHQHSPSVPQITMLSDMRVVALSQKDNNFATYNKLIRSHSSIATGDLQLFHTGKSWWSHLCCKQRGQRSLVAITWTSLGRVHNRTMVLMHSKLAQSSQGMLIPSGQWSSMCR